MSLFEGKGPIKKGPTTANPGLGNRNSQAPEKVIQPGQLTETQLRFRENLPTIKKEQ